MRDDRVGARPRVTGSYFYGGDSAMYGANAMMEVLPDGTVEILGPRHWWCVRCGRWEECDDADRCRECAWIWRGSARPGWPRERNRAVRSAGR